jgi:hypothetical protein
MRNLSTTKKLASHQFRSSSSSFAYSQNGWREIPVCTSNIQNKNQLSHSPFSPPGTNPDQTPLQRAPRSPRVRPRASVTTATRRSHYQRKDAAHSRDRSKTKYKPPHTKETQAQHRPSRGRRFWSLPTPTPPPPPSPLDPPPAAPPPIRRGSRSRKEVCWPRTLLVSYPVLLVDVGGFPCSWSWFFVPGGIQISLYFHTFSLTRICVPRGAVLFPVSKFRCFFLRLPGGSSSASPAVEIGCSRRL